METNLDQVTDNQNESVTKVSLNQKLFAFLAKRFKDLSPLEVIVYSLNTLLIMIIFGSGIRTMINEVVGSFPISELFYLPVGFILMGIVVMATHLVTKHSAELCFHWSRYATPYKILLPITNVLLLIFCWSVQTEGGEIMLTEEIDEQIKQIEQDTSSANLQQLDANIQLFRIELHKSDSTINAYNQLRESRSAKWLNPSENQIYLTAQTSKQQLTAQLSSFTQNRLAEVERIEQQKEMKLARLEQERQRKIQKGRGKAGLAEVILVFSAFFMMAYHNRFVTQDVESQDLIQAFPKGLSLEEREEMVKHFKALDYDPESQVLLISYQFQKYYLEIDKYIALMRTCKSKLENTNRSTVRENKVRNLSYYERVLSLTGLSIQEIQEQFSYAVLNLDYWNNTTDTAISSGMEPLNNRYISLNTS
ncbi:MAG: hypothetical protein ACPGJS_00760 [Flammeovirgaceae bacterium]